MPRSADNRAFAAVIGVLLLALMFAAFAAALSISPPSTQRATVDAGDMPTLVTIGRSATTLVVPIAPSATSHRFGPGRTSTRPLRDREDHRAAQVRIFTPLRI